MWPHGTKLAGISTGRKGKNGTGCLGGKEKGKPERASHSSRFWDTWKRVSYQKGQRKKKELNAGIPWKRSGRGAVLVQPIGSNQISLIGVYRDWKGRNKILPVMLMRQCPFLYVFRFVFCISAWASLYRLALSSHCTVLYCYCTGICKSCTTNSILVYIMNLISFLPFLLLFGWTSIFS